MILVGAGSHAARLVSLFGLQKHITAYSSPTPAIWLNEPRLGDTPLKRFETDEDALAHPYEIFCMGMGGVRPEQLAKRLEVARFYGRHKYRAMTLRHDTAFLASDSGVMEGVQIMNGAQISAHAIICEHALINAGAIVEHHALIGAGSHIAPGAVILGNVVIGEACMIGANATVIEGTKVPDGTMVKANTVWKGVPAGMVVDPFNRGKLVREGEEWWLGHERRAG